MYISKKKKMFLMAGVPASIVILSAAIAAPIVVSQENSAFSVLDNSKNYNLKLIDDQKMEQLVNQNILYYNPKEFSKDFFVKNIANQTIQKTNESDSSKIEIINSNNVLFTLDGYNNNSSSNSNDDIKYNVRKIEEKGNKFVATIDKEYKNRVRTYEQEININEDFFNSDVTLEQKNFLAYSYKHLKQIFQEQKALVSLNSSQNQNNNNITSNDLVLTGQEGILFSKDGKDGSYISKLDKKLKFGNEYVNIGFDVVGGKIWNASEVWKLDAQGNFDYDNSPAIKYLLTIKDKLFLPKLDPSEIEGLTEEQIQRKQLTKFLFTPDSDPTEIVINGGKEIKQPNSSYNPILVKLTLGENETYLVTWQYVEKSVQDNLVKMAPEIKYQTKRNNENVWPSAEEIQQDFNLLELTIAPNKDLEYKIKEVTIPTEDNPNNDKVRLKVEISSKIDPKLKKEYETIVDKGIKSKQQVELDKFINDKLQGNSDISAITPTITITKGIEGINYNTITTFINSLNNNIKNLEKFNEVIKLTNPSGVDGKISYVPTYVWNQFLNGKEYVVISYDIASPNNSNAISAVVPSIDVKIEWT